MDGVFLAVAVLVSMLNKTQKGTPSFQNTLIHTDTHIRLLTSVLENYCNDVRHSVSAHWVAVLWQIAVSSYRKGIVSVIYAILANILLSAC